MVVGLVMIMYKIFGGEVMMSFWYYFVIMFEVLFIFILVDVGICVVWFMFFDVLGNFWLCFKDYLWKVGFWLIIVIMVVGWGLILFMGVIDLLGGINIFFLFFGIVN